MKEKILLVDDEPLILKGLRFALKQEGYLIDEAKDGETAYSKIMSEEYDLVLLDVMLPGLSGIEVCQRVRESSEVPIIMLTAKGEDMDKILGLEYGADDYMTKPFNILEVKARIKRILHRTKKKTDKSAVTRLSWNGLTLDTQTRLVEVEDRNVVLTAKEYDLLLFLMSNPGRVFSREELLEVVWGPTYTGDSRTVDVHVRRLREKVEPDPANPRYVMTRWGVGYHFATE